MGGSLPNPRIPVGDPGVGIPHERKMQQIEPLYVRREPDIGKRQRPAGKPWIIAEDGIHVREEILEPLKRGRQPYGAQAVE